MTIKKPKFFKRKMRKIIKLALKINFKKHNPIWASIHIDKVSVTIVLYDRQKKAINKQLGTINYYKSDPKEFYDIACNILKNYI